MKVTLDRLRKTTRVQNDKPQEVRNLSDVVSTTVWTFKKFGYESDLKAEANVSLAVDKLSQELKIKWKDNTKATKLERPSLVDFSLWLKGQADIYDDCYPKVSGRFSSQLSQVTLHLVPSQKIPLALWEMEKDTSYLLVPSLRP